MVVVMVTMMMLRCESGRREEQNHGEEQSLFHVQIIATMVGRGRPTFGSNELRGTHIGPVVSRPQFRSSG